MNQVIPFYGRNQQLNEIEKFIQTGGSGLAYLRGRRRVGKSSLLRKFCLNHPKQTFYFMAQKDASDLKNRLQFAINWDQFSQESYLSELRPHLISWKRLFDQITSHVQKNKTSLFICFDEIHWLCKKGSGVASAIKEAWLDWEHLPIKVIICGSSRKFFKNEVEGDEKILRGLKTHSDIILPEFSLKEVRQYYFPQWSTQEIVLTYMMLGGLPHYLNQIDSQKNFIIAINDAIFLKDAIFLEEVNEVLGLEFNKAGVETAKTILSVLGQDGKEHAKIVQQTGKSPSLATEMLEKLLDYEIVFEKFPIKNSPHRKKTLGPRFYMKDYYLNFFFQVLVPLEKKIKINEKALLFATQCLSTYKGFYIPHFTGKAFELLLRRILEDYQNREAKIFDKLAIRDVDYEVGTYWDSQTQIDLIVESRVDRLSRLIECKWSNAENLNLMTFVEKLVEKKYQSPPHFKKCFFIATSCEITPSLIEKAKKEDCLFITLDNLF